MIIETNEINEQTIRNINQKSEQIKARFNMFNARMEKEMIRRDENIRSEIRQTQQGIRNDIELRIQEVHAIFDNLSTLNERSAQNNHIQMDSLNVKLESIMRDMGNNIKD